QVGAQLAPYHRSEARVSVDDGNRIDDLDLADVELYVPTGESVLRRYPGADLASAMRAARAAGARDVVVTLGSEGCAVLVGDDVRLLPAFAVDVVSTLGAGDVFHGALVLARAEGLAIEDAARFASAAAALSCRSVDGQSGIPTRAEIDALLLAQRPKGDR